MTPMFTCRYALGFSCLSLLWVAGCGPQLPPVADATQTPHPTAASTMAPSESATPTLTETPLPTATPEWLNADPNTEETWPQWAQEYFANPDKASDEDDRRFDQFITDARNSYFELIAHQDPERLRVLLDFLIQGSVLTSATREVIGGMTQADLLDTLRSMYEDDANQDLLPHRHLLWLSLINNAIEMRSTILSPNEIRRITSDRDAYFETWYGLLPSAPEELAQYVVQYGFEGSIHDGDDIPFNMRDWQPIVFGKRIRNPVHISFYERLIGDIAGLVQLPGQSGFAMLMRVRSQEGEPYLHIFHLEDTGLEFGPGTMPCLGAPFSGATFGLMECPETLSGEKSWFRVYPDGFHRGIRGQVLDNAAVRDWLAWPPVFIRQHEIQEQVGGGLVVYILHPKTNLIVARRVQIYPPDEHQNQP